MKEDKGCGFFALILLAIVALVYIAIKFIGTLPRLETLLPKYAPFCETAFDQPFDGPNQKIEAPMVIIHRAGSRNWDALGYLDKTAHNANQVNSLVCIQGVYTNSGEFYVGGGDVLTVDWKIRALTLPEGKVVGEGVLNGADKQGYPNTDELSKWINSMAK